MNDVDVEAVCRVTLVVAPPMRDALQGDALAANETFGCNSVSSGGRLKFLGILSAIFRIEISIKLTGAGVQSAAKVKGVGLFIGQVNGDGEFVELRDTSEFLGVEVIVPRRINPGGLMEIKSIQVVVGPHRLSVCEAGGGVEFKVNSQTIVGNGPTLS